MRPSSAGGLSGDGAAGSVADEPIWPRAVGLLFITFILFVMLSLSISAGVLVAFPFLALMMVLGLRRVPAAVAAVFAVFVAVVYQREEASGISNVAGLSCLPVGLWC